MTDGAPERTQINPNVTPNAGSYVNLAPGDPAPWFHQASTSNPNYAFDTTAGRYVVLCFLGSANRDERRFVRPEVFNIFRPEADPARAFTGGAQHLAFGAGRHVCLGAVLARFEVQIAVNELLNAMDAICFAAGTPPADSGLFLRGPQTLALRFRPWL